MRKKRVKLDRKSRRALKHIAGKMAGNQRIYEESIQTVSSYGSLSFGSSLKVAGSSKQSSRPLDLPAIENTVYVSKYFLEFKTNSDHRYIFSELHPNIDWTVISRRATDNAISHDQYAFYTQEDRAVFENWMEKYLSKFGEYTKMSLPPPNGQTIMVKSNFRKGEDEFSLNDSKYRLEQWLWILRNCEGEVRHTGDFWFFEKQEDADIFSMAFM